MSDDPFAAADWIMAGLDVARLEEVHRREMEALLLGLIDVVDSLHALGPRCRDVGQGDGSLGLNKTVERIERQALSVLARVGVEPIDAPGGLLDLEQHEVVDVRPAEDRSEDTVIEEIVRGYFWRKRLLRRAKVAIARTKSEMELRQDGDDKGERS